MVLEELSSSQENELLNIFGGATQSNIPNYEVRKPFVYIYLTAARICFDFDLTKKLTGFEFGRLNFLNSTFVSFGHAALENLLGRK